MFCPLCGTKNEEEAVFCAGCGARLTDEPIPEKVAAGSREDPTEGFVPEDSMPENIPEAIPEDTVVGPDLNEIPAPILSAAGGGGHRGLGLGLLVGGGVAAVALVCALVMLVSGLFASPKTRVRKALGKTVAAYEQIGEKMGLPEMKLAQKQASSVRLGARLDSVDSSMGIEGSVMEGMEAQLSWNTDLKKRKMDATVTALWDGNDILSAQMLLDDDQLLVGSPQFTEDVFYGINTKTLGETLYDMGAEDKDLQDLSFNVFDLIEILQPSDKEKKEIKKLTDKATREFYKEIKVEKRGSQSIRVNGNSVKATAYRVELPQDAVEDYLEALYEANMEVRDPEKVMETLLEAMGAPRDAIKEITDSMDTSSSEREFKRAVEQIMDALGDIELDVYVKGGYIYAVEYDERIEGETVKLSLQLGGGKTYVNDWSLEMELGDYTEVKVESSGDHLGKKGTFTDETTAEITNWGDTVKVTSQFSYRPKEKKGDNLTWELKGGDDYYSVSLEAEGRMTTTKDSLDLDLKEVELRADGKKLLSMGLNCYIGPYKAGVKAGEKVMITDMSRKEMERLVEDLAENGQDWAKDMEKLATKKLGRDISDYLFGSPSYGYDDYYDYNDYYHSDYDDYYHSGYDDYYDYSDYYHSDYDDYYDYSDYYNSGYDDYYYGYDYDGYDYGAPSYYDFNY